MKVKKKGKSGGAATPPGSSRRPLLWALAAAIVYAAIEAYGPALHGPFVYDDFSLPFYNPYFRTEHLKAWIDGVRPLLMFSYWANFQWSGKDTFSYHLLNLIFHLANSALVYLIALRLVSREVTDNSRRQIYAGFAASLFLLHPIQTESVSWIAGRSESLSALFFLAAFAIFLFRPPDAIGWGRSLGILVLFACAVASKENTAILPVLLVATDLYWAEGDRVAAVRKNWRLYGLMAGAAVVAGAVVWRVVSTSTSAGYEGTGVGWLAYALTQCRVFFVYLRLFLFPAGQNIDYDFPWSSVRLAFWPLAGLAGIIALVAIAWRMRRRFPVASYAFLVFLILLAPTSSIIPIKDPIAERRLYLPMLGLALVAAEFLIRLNKERAWAIATAGVLLAAAALTTYHRNQLWGSEAALWEDTVAKSPNKLRGYGHLVHGLIEEHRCGEALQRLEDLSKRMPVDPALLGHWAVAYECLHQPEQAIAKLRLAAAQAPDANTYLNIARNQVLLGNVEDAIESLNRALDLNADLDSAYVMRAELYAKLGDYSTAVRDYREALHLNPNNQIAQAGLEQMAARPLNR